MLYKTDLKEVDEHKKTTPVVPPAITPYIYSVEPYTVMLLPNELLASVNFYIYPSLNYNHTIIVVFSNQWWLSTWPRPFPSSHVLLFAEEGSGLIT